MCTSTHTKKGRSRLKNVLEFFPYIIDLVDKAETMDSVYCVHISGKYLIFYYRGGRFAGLESAAEVGRVLRAPAGEAEGARERKRHREEER